MAPPMARPTTTQLIAPCGINCRLCRAYGRERNPCPGCRAGGRFSSEGGLHCSVHCARLAAGAVRYCFECGDFPCKALRHLEDRYGTKYATSPLENLQHIQSRGIRSFVRQQDEAWACPQCGELLCMHIPVCQACGYRWNEWGSG